MEIFMVCTIVIAFIIIFTVLGCKLSSKLELKSQYEKPIPDNLQPASEKEKELLKNKYELVGTIYGEKYTKSLVEKWCQTLYVSYGIVVDVRDSITIGNGIQNTVRYAKIKIDNIQFETTLEDAAIDDNVIAFYSKDDSGQMVYRFVIRKEKQK